MPLGQDIVKVDAPPPLAPVKRGDRQSRFLAQSVLLEEGGSSGLIRVATLTISTVVAAFLGWAAITEVEEVAVAQGEVVPSGQIQSVQHLEGGIIKEIIVQDGDLVERDQPMLRMDPQAAYSEHEQMRARAIGLGLKAERLRSVGAGVKPDFSKIPEAQKYPSLILDQQSIYESQIASRDNRREVLLKQLEQKKSDISLLRDREATLRQGVSLLQEEFRLRDSLLKQGLTTKVLYLDIKRELNVQQGELSKLQSERSRAFESLNEATQKLLELDTTLRETAMVEMGTVTAELAQVNESLAKLDDRVRRLEVRAPVRGVVKGMKTHTVGGVIPPGGVALEIVPLEKELIVEAKISTRDVGHVRVGQPVKVKVTTYDYARYGGITGELKDISASTFLDEKDKNQPYYRGVVSLDRNYVGFDPERNRVLPGMTVQADITTGKKTLLQYLLKPVYSSISESFRER
ncbi:MAG: HlyD family type I secretion periplasmic adaptor subunit [Magnetospirillum sp. WYHS-4]